MSANWYRPWASREGDEQNQGSELGGLPEGAEAVGAESDNGAAAEAADDSIETCDADDEGHAEPLEQQAADDVVESAEPRPEPGNWSSRSSHATGPTGIREPAFSSGAELPRRPLGWNGKSKGRGLVKPDEVRLAFSPHERLLILDTWQRSGLPAGDFAPLVGLSKHTLYMWKKRFTEYGPAGLAERPRGAKTGSKLSEVTRRTIVMLKQAHPDWGCQRISDELVRGPAMAARPRHWPRGRHLVGLV
jgi:transposase